MVSSKTADKFFDSYAEGFDAIYGGSGSFFNRIISRLFRKSMRERYEYTLKGCRPVEGRSALDIGCGPGHYGIALAKMGAERVVGLDFAPDMLRLARKYAANAGVSDKCKFLERDFMEYNPEVKFDYSIVMGVMDYIADAESFARHVLEVTSSKAFFSFPSSQHWLSLQRKIRYKFKCDLYLYSRREVEELFERLSPEKYKVDDLRRDYFVTVFLS
ncbi:MAG: methyltransferase domain-containing protein [candidate division Zixibacteria bacterium]|nr:methyltransferase domain-containing protein [candidate division Zixibacteria bacterium]